MRKTEYSLRSLFPYLKNYRRELIWMMITSGIGSVIDIGVPLFQRYALNRFVAEGNLSTLPPFVVIYAAAIVFAAAMNYISCIWGMKIEVGVDRDLRNAAFSRLQTLSFSYFNQNSVGYIHSRVMSDTQRIGELLSWTLLNCAWQLSYLIGAIVVNLWLKVVIARPRPYSDPEGIYYPLWLMLGSHTESDFSFPSGHTNAAFATMVPIFLLGKKNWSWLALLFGVLMGISRIYLVVHFPSDVLGGAITGTIAGILGMLITSRIPADSKWYGWDLRKSGHAM